MKDLKSINPAFPVVELDRFSGKPCDQHMGMTLREYFAIRALQGLLSGVAGEVVGVDGGENVCLTAVNMADQLLKQLEKPKP